MALLDANGVERSALDTGQFPTVPAEPFGLATDDAFLSEYESQRLAEFVLAPAEVDPTLTQPVGLRKVINSVQGVSAPLGKDAVKVADESGLLCGYTTSAIRPMADFTSQRWELGSTVMRFPDAESAARAARGFHEAALRGLSDLGGEGAAPVSLPSPGGSTPYLVSRRVSPARQGDALVMQGFATQGDYVLSVYVTAPVQEEAWVTQTVSAALDRGLPLLAQFRGFPTTSQNGGTPAPRPKIDQDEVLIYAIPFPEADTERTGDDIAVYGPRGMSHRSPDPLGTEKLLTEVGADHTGIGASTVYRADTDAGATRVLDHLTTVAGQNGYAATEPPAGLPGAKCLSKPADSMKLADRYACYVQVGRYVGEVSELTAPRPENDNRGTAELSAAAKKIVDQAISAQYLILTQADQNR